MVVPAYGEVLEALNPGGTSLGLRIPSCDLSRDLLRRTGPLATSSANPSGDPAATTPEQAALYFPDLPQLGPQPWPPLSGPLLPTRGPLWGAPAGRPGRSPPSPGVCPRRRREDLLVRYCGNQSAPLEHQGSGGGARRALARPRPPIHECSQLNVGQSATFAHCCTEATRV